MTRDVGNGWTGCVKGDCVIDEGCVTVSESGHGWNGGEGAIERGWEVLRRPPLHAGSRWLGKLEAPIQFKEANSCHIH